MSPSLCYYYPVAAHGSLPLPFSSRIAEFCTERARLLLLWSSSSNRHFQINQVLTSRLQIGLSASFP
ncbi:hypothetical protein KFK09_017417 [Dendrobium nobile]|uniref:Uncharacterized protein n=1 Tax=Dendrobium nobile TaxID=94219 RepID=A0A8T3B2G4_DENNO|nr:hypothetical protein KFK09_017409 [Dendrobium nobile]KAI0502464.1 hypothetical protein KFK09_017417 [Dendrobium nobile]